MNREFFYTNLILEKGVEEKQEIGLTHKYNKLTTKGKTNGIQKIHHPNEITKDTWLNTLTIQWTTQRDTYYNTNTSK